MEGLLIKLCVAILEKLLMKGTDAWFKFKALQDELKLNEQKAKAYKEVVDGNKSREERQKAEDDLLS